MTIQLGDKETLKELVMIWRPMEIAQPLILPSRFQ